MKNKLIRLFLFVVIFSVFGQCIYLWQEKQLLQTALIERVKAISLYEQFTREVLSYLSQSKKRDKQLEKNIQEFLDYMAVYSTEEQKGSSRKFMQEVSENLKKQILKQMENEGTFENQVSKQQESQEAQAPQSRSHTRLNTTNRSEPRQNLSIKN